MNKLILFLLIVLVSCSQNKNGGDAQLVVSFGSLSGGPSFVGGAIVEVVNAQTNESKVIELIRPYNITLSFGEWSIRFVGYDGPNWQGPHYCGGVENFLFQKNDQTVKIQVNQANCEVEPYLSLKNSRPLSDKWDVAIWDQAKWE